MPDASLDYIPRRKKKAWLGSRFCAVMFSLTAAILAVIYISLTNGEFDMTIAEVVKTLLKLDVSKEFELVVFEFRLPRIVIACLVGFGLGIAGAVIQGVTRNGLADPGLLGINAGAGAAIVVFMFFFQGQIRGTDWLAALSMPLFGLVGGLGSALLIYALALQHGRLDPSRLLLTGIAVGSGFGAISLYLTLKMSAGDYEMAVVWTSGSIWNANWTLIASMLPWLIALTPVMMAKSRILDLMQLEESSARSLGIAVDKERAVLILGSVGIVSACVSVSGGIGFIGLMAPHIARRLVGLQHSRMLPVCGFTGMLLVVLADFIARTALAPAELPVGIVISIIGVPCFIWMLFQQRRRKA